MAKNKWVALNGMYESKIDGCVCQGSGDLEWWMKLIQHVAVNRSGRMPIAVYVNDYAKDDKDPPFMLKIPVEDVGQFTKPQQGSSAATGGEAQASPPDSYNQDPDDDLPF